jgi:hypothetical protein
MPQYHFHLRDGAGTLPDAEGDDYADLAAALRAASWQIRGLLGQEMRESGEIRLDRWIDIADSSGKVVETLAFANAVTVFGGPTTPTITNDTLSQHTQH